MGECCNSCCDNSNGNFLGFGNGIWIIIAIIVIVWLIGDNSSGNNCCGC